MMHMQAFNMLEFCETCASNSAEGHWLVLKSAWNENSQYMTNVNYFVNDFFLQNALTQSSNENIFLVMYASLLPSFSLL